MNTDHIYEVIEGAANMLRGMTMDPAVPGHAKQAMQARIQELEEALDDIEPHLGA